MYETFSAQRGLLIAMVICGMAIWRGGWAERWSGAVYLTAWILSGIVYTKQNIIGPDWAVFAVDFTTLLGLGWISFRSRRPWTLFVAAFALIAIMAPLALALDFRVTTFTYVRGLALWSYALLLGILWGTVEVELARRRARRAGLDAS